jgi:glycosyltransferase involved in cell wall biosynthesis
VCSDIPAFREIAENSALFFNPRDIKDIKEKIKLVLESESTSNRLKNKGTENAKRFNWENSASSLLKIIHHYENSSNK